jgi:hypothetical protein
MPIKRGLQSSPRLLKDNHIGAAVHPDRIGKVFYVLGQDMRQCLICDGVFTGQAAAEHAGTACLPSQRSPSFDGEIRMQIGEPLRIIVVEPLDLPLNDPQNQPEPIAPEPDPEGEPATK